MRKLFIVSCTRGRKEETDLYRSLRKLGADCFLFIENNRKGVSTCYNRILDEKSGRDEIVIFVHDDVTIGDLFPSGEDHCGIRSGKLRHCRLSRNLGFQNSS